MAGVKQVLHYGVLHELEQMEHDRQVVLAPREYVTPGEAIVLYDDANELHCDGLVMQVTGINPLVAIVLLKRDTLRPGRPEEKQHADEGEVIPDAGTDPAVRNAGGGQT